jgi:hypothetical protein
MSHFPRFYEMLKSDKDDQARAVVLDAWMAEQPEPIRNACRYKIWILSEADGLSEVGAKAMLLEAIILAHDNTDDQDRKRAKGEAIRQAYEWSQAPVKKVKVKG